MALLSERLWSEMLAFLADAKDRAEDNAPRLILADWLEEHGDATLAARGELIRLQCWAPFTEESRARQQVLLQRYAQTWLGTLRDAVTGWSCRRGMFHVRLRTDLLFGREEPFEPDDFVWIDGLSVDRLLSSQVLPLVTAPWLAWLNVLYLPHCQLGDRGVEALAACPAVRRLRELYLRDNRISAAGARALAASPHLGQLRILALGGNDLGAEGARVLLESPLAPHLTQLGLGNNRLSDLDRQALQALAGHFPQLWLHLES